MKILNFVILIEVLFNTISLALAADCQEIPSCASLGYTMNLAQCTKRPVLRCPFDRTSDQSVWCPKGEIKLKCLSGNYFNIETHSCYPKQTSDFVFIDDTPEGKTLLLKISDIEILQEKSFEEMIQLGTSENTITTDDFYKLIDYLFKNLGKNCYIVAENKEHQGTLVYLNANGIATKINQTDFQKYCLEKNKQNTPISKAFLLKYTIAEDI